MAGRPLCLAQLDQSSHGYVEASLGLNPGRGAPRRLLKELLMVGVEGALEAALRGSEEGRRVRVLMAGQWSAQLLADVCRPRIDITLVSPIKPHGVHTMGLWRSAAKALEARGAEPCRFALQRADTNGAGHRVAAGVTIAREPSSIGSLSGRGFDLVVDAGSTYETPWPLRTLRSLARRLRPGGRLVSLCERPEAVMPLRTLKMNPVVFRSWLRGPLGRGGTAPGPGARPAIGDGVLPSASELLLGLLSTPKEPEDGPESVPFVSDLSVVGARATVREALSLEAAATAAAGIAQAYQRVWLPGKPALMPAEGLLHLPEDPFPDKATHCRREYPVRLGQPLAASLTKLGAVTLRLAGVSTAAATSRTGKEGEGEEDEERVLQRVVAASGALIERVGARATGAPDYVIDLWRLALLVEPLAPQPADRALDNLDPLLSRALTVLHSEPFEPVPGIRYGKVEGELGTLASMPRFACVMPGGVVERCGTAALAAVASAPLPPLVDAFPKSLLKSLHVAATALPSYLVFVAQRGGVSDGQHDGASAALPLTAASGQPLGSAWAVPAVRCRAMGANRANGVECRSSSAGARALLAPGRPERCVVWQQQRPGEGGRLTLYFDPITWAGLSAESANASSGATGEAQARFNAMLAESNPSELFRRLPARAGGQAPALRDEVADFLRKAAKADPLHESWCGAMAGIDPDQPQCGHGPEALGWRTGGGGAALGEFSQAPEAPEATTWRPVLRLDPAGGVVEVTQWSLGGPERPIAAPRPSEAKPIRPVPWFKDRWLHIIGDSLDRNVVAGLCGAARRLGVRADLALALPLLGPTVAAWQNTRHYLMPHRTHNVACAMGGSRLNVTLSSTFLFGVSNATRAPTPASLGPQLDPSQPPHAQPTEMTDRLERFLARPAAGLFAGSPPTETGEGWCGVPPSVNWWLRTGAITCSNPADGSRYWPHLDPEGGLWCAEWPPMSITDMDVGGAFRNISAGVDGPLQHKPSHPCDLEGPGRLGCFHAGSHLGSPVARLASRDQATRLRTHRGGRLPGTSGSHPASGAVWLGHQAAAGPDVLVVQSSLWDLHLAWGRSLLMHTASLQHLPRILRSHTGTGFGSLPESEQQRVDTAGPHPRSALAISAVCMASGLLRGEPIGPMYRLAWERMFAPFAEPLRNRSVSASALKLLAPCTAAVGTPHPLLRDAIAALPPVVGDADELACSLQREGCGAGGQLLFDAAEAAIRAGDASAFLDTPHLGPEWPDLGQPGAQATRVLAALTARRCVLDLTSTDCLDPERCRATLSDPAPRNRSYFNNGVLSHTAAAIHDIRFGGRSSSATAAQLRVTSECLGAAAGLHLILPLGDHIQRDYARGLERLLGAVTDGVWRVGTRGQAPLVVFRTNMGMNQTRTRHRPHCDNAVAALGLRSSDDIGYHPFDDDMTTAVREAALSVAATMPVSEFRFNELPHWVLGEDGFHLSHQGARLYTTALFHLLRAAVPSSNHGRQE